MRNKEVYCISDDNKLTWEFFDISRMHVSTYKPTSHQAHAVGNALTNPDVASQD
ncbi:MAG: hypothetical protein IKO73_04405 [Bacteroidaceae bacterium]|nr:hypothetical protein [Bacteroidaceae bacterium]